MEAFSIRRIRLHRSNCGKFSKLEDPCSKTISQDALKKDSFDTTGGIFPIYSHFTFTIELADLLFVYKHFLNGVLDAYRAVLVQAKYTKGKKKSWKIDTDQFYFLTQWPRFRIVRPAFKKSYSTKPRALTWSTYGFVGPNATRYPVYYSSERMLRQRTSFPSSNTFIFGVQTPIGWDSSTSFLLKFVQGFAGENLLSNSTVRAFVNDLYVVAKWKPDPPGEPKWENENEEREGFGIVEFTVSTERGEQ